MTKLLKRLIALAAGASMFSFVTLFADASGIIMQSMMMLTIGLSIFMAIFTYITIKNKLEDLW